MSGRPLRADGQRNRDRVLAVAQAAFAADGLTVPIQEIAHRAGVSTGTVSRHFPTKAALVEAVLLSVLERLAADARAEATAPDPGAAFFDFFRRLVTEGTANKALFDTLATAAPDSRLKTAVSAAGEELFGGLAALLQRAQADGQARADLRPGDLMAVVVGALAMQAQAAEPRGSARLLEVACDALRPR